MRYRPRFLLALACLPCLLFAAAGVWSTYAWASISHGTPGAAGRGLCLDAGGLYFATFDGDFRPGWVTEYVPDVRWSSMEQDAGSEVRRWLPVRTMTMKSRPVRFWVIALWLPTLVLALPPLWLALRHRQRQRQSPGLCPACGYNLHGTPDRCPECGRESGLSPVETGDDAGRV